MQQHPAEKIGRGEQNISSRLLAYISCSVSRERAKKSEREGRRDRSPTDQRLPRRMYPVGTSNHCRY